ncbi:hypothetical protein L6452_31345 [Arctium lappa]|uniref:Uncharacterized protein n=1 Tax=Arctium lappa TaxID=4217 RepID=A0ACB8ZL08_ARCLA|nr:hypothetical protein L6452_31345 [Arctium lappa]
MFNHIMHGEFWHIYILIDFDLWKLDLSVAFMKLCSSTSPSSTSTMHIQMRSAVEIETWNVISSQHT